MNAHAALDLSDCVMITDQTDTIYLIHEASGERIDTATFLENAPTSINGYWGESKWRRVASSYKNIRDQFKKRDFIKEVTKEIAKVAPNFNSKKVCIRGSIALGEYDFDSEMFKIKLPSNSTQHINSGVNPGYNVSWKNPKYGFFYKTTSEEEARRIESQATENRSRGLPAMFYFSAVDKSNLIDGKNLALELESIKAIKQGTKFKDLDSSVLFEISLDGAIKETGVNKDFYVGNWIGEATTRMMITYPVELSIEIDNDNSIVGVANYPSYRCTGQLTELRNGNDLTIELQEVKETSTKCAAKGRIVLTKEDDNHIKWEWFRPRGSMVSSTALLMRRD